MSFNLKKYASEKNGDGITEKQLEKSRVSKDSTDTQEVQLDDNRAKSPSQLTEKQLPQKDKPVKETTENQLSTLHDSKKIESVEEIQLKDFHGEPPSQTTEKQLASSDLRKNAGKQKADVVNEIQLEDHRSDIPSQLTEKQLDAPRDNATQQTVLVEGQLNKSKDGLVKHRNEETSKGNINKLEEKRLSGKKESVQELSKPEPASETPKNRMWNTKSDENGLRLAQKIDDSLGGIADFMNSPMGQGTVTDPSSDFEISGDSFEEPVETVEPVDDEADEDRSKIILDKDAPVSVNIGGTPVTKGSVKFRLKGFLDEKNNLVKEELDKSILDYLASRHSIKAPVLGPVNINVQDQTGVVGYLASMQ